MRFRTALFLGLMFSFVAVGEAASVDRPIVQAILFYSPTCPHCHQVINELLIPMQERYGEQLSIIGIDTSHPAGSELYDQALKEFEIPENRQGVPLLIVGDTVLIGGVEIPDLFPIMLEEGLASGGIGWPHIPGLEDAVPDLPPTAGSAAEAEIAATTTVQPEEASTDQETTPQSVVPSLEEQTITATSSLTDNTEDLAAEQQPIPALEIDDQEEMTSEIENPPDDPLGFTLAAFVLLGMVLALIFCVRWLILSQVVPYLMTATSSNGIYPPRSIIYLAMIGLGISIYLSYVEITQVEAVCGPVGQCNIVQGSPYAKIAGIPVAVLGALAYLGIAILWTGQRLLSNRDALTVLLVLIFVAIFGTVFSIYLTCMELFVIRAICAWCLSSAVITSLIMLLTVTSVTRRFSLGKQ